MWTTQVSEIDDSVNFIHAYGKSFYECRYVRRQDNQVVVYLSSHNGCNMSCRFCHLTATGQTSMEPVSIDSFMVQTQKVLSYWKDSQKNGLEKVVNFNFMARGEPLENPVILEKASYLQHCLSRVAAHHELTPIFNISTIIPRGLEKPLKSIFNSPTAETRLYWSLYSTKEKFRKRWLPKAMEPTKAAAMVNEYRQWGGNVVLHNAFIKGQNDSLNDIKELVGFLEQKGLLDCDFNIVAYNPYSPKYGEETDRTDDIYDILSASILGRVQIIERVGKDVNASCGMFYSR